MPVLTKEEIQLLREMNQELCTTTHNRVVVADEHDYNSAKAKAYKIRELLEKIIEFNA